ARAALRADPARHRALDGDAVALLDVPDASRLLARPRDPAEALVSGDLRVARPAARVHVSVELLDVGAAHAGGLDAQEGVVGTEPFGHGELLQLDVAVSCLDGGEGRRGSRHAMSSLPVGRPGPPPPQP